MKTRIVEREDVRSIPALSAMHGPKGVLGNQEIGGGLPYCVIEEICDGDDERDLLHGGGEGHCPHVEEEGLQGPSAGGL